MARKNTLDLRGQYYSHYKLVRKKFFQAGILEKGVDEIEDDEDFEGDDLSISSEGNIDTISSICKLFFHFDFKSNFQALTIFLSENYFSFSHSVIFATKIYTSTHLLRFFNTGATPSSIDRSF